jgi:hypothetical protein
MLLGKTGFTVHRQLMFSRIVNFHALKHSLLNWCMERHRSRVPYYALKSALFGFQNGELGALLGIGKITWW